VRRSLFAACLAATVVICADAAPAGADTTLRGRILGQPQLSGAHARVPLLLANGTAVVLTVPARSGFRTATTGRTTADGTRLGDAVSAEVRAVRAGRASATYLKIVTRSPAPTFDDLRAQLGAASTGAKEAVDAVGRIGAAQAGGPQDPAALRFTLLGLRAQLNTLIASLRDQADNMSKVATSIKDRPSAHDLTRQLGDTAGGARSAATKLEKGVTGLDEFINSIGGVAGGPPPAAGVDTVTQVLNTALQVLDGLHPQGGPALPGPLGGVQPPDVPAALPG
jgi:hypothetical protein